MKRERKSKFLIKLICFFFLFFTSSSFAQTRVLMEEYGGVYLVPCKINGLPMKFILDTGASDVSISLTEAMFMLKNGFLSTEDIGGKVRYSIANGDIHEGTLVNIKVIEIEGHFLYNVSASIVHETKAPLLLGLSAISKLGTIQLSGNELIILKKREIDSYSDFNKNMAVNINKNLEYKIQKVNDEAMAAYEKKDYNTAGPKFGELYNLLKAAGQDNKQYLYYSAITYAVSDYKDKAVEAFNHLIDSGYTGSETKYLARNRTGHLVTLEKKAWEYYKKNWRTKEYKDFTTETAKNIEAELYESNIVLLSELRRYDEAISLADKAIKKFPNNSKFEEAKGLAFYNSGNTDQFMASLKNTVTKNPNDKNSWYNLGVLAGKDPARLDEALGYLKKATDIDPKFANAWQNMAFLTIGDDEKVMKEYNDLRKSGKVDEANAVIDARRKRMASALPVAEKWYQADPENIDAVSLLRGLYTSTRNEAKAAEFKAKEAALQAKGK